MGEHLYHHFHIEEHPFVDRLLDRIRICDQQHEAFWTDFFDPRQQFIAESLVNRHVGLHIQFDGGHPEAERKRAWIAPDYLLTPPEPAPICLLHVFSIDQRLAQLKHGDYLGALLGLGIKREKVGDLFVFDEGCHLLLAEELASFVELHFSQVSRLQVQLQRLSLKELNAVPHPLEEREITVASLRLDGMISEVCHLSRAKAVVPIKAGKCKVNWRVEESPSATLHAGDLVSVKGWGRFRVLEVRGLTKKGNLRVKIGKFV